MFLPASIADGFAKQADACRSLGSAFNASVCDLLRERLTADSAFGRRIRDWPGNPVEDALALRACGGLHALSRSGRCPELTAAYPPALATAPTLWPAVAAAIARHDSFLTDYLDSPPQTNEVSRSGMLLGGCLTIARDLGLPLAIYEIGSSAGLNLGFDGYRYDLGVGAWGPPASDVRIVSRWDGSAPLDAPLSIVHREGCDRNPLDPAAAADRDRLLSYIWPDQSDRLDRIAAALQAAADARRRV